MDYISLEGFPPIFYFCYGKGSKGKYPQCDTGQNLTGSITLLYTIQNENKSFSFSSTFTSLQNANKNNGGDNIAARSSLPSLRMNGQGGLIHERWKDSEKGGGSHSPSSFDADR